MAARSALLALCLTLGALAGCSGSGPSPPPREVAPPDVGYDAANVRVDGVSIVSYNVTATDGVKLSAVAYVPTAAQPVAWPVVVFLHGWGDRKEDYRGIDRTGLPSGEDHMMTFAQAGILAVAYDARGFGASGGKATVAGPLERSDLDVVLADAASRFGDTGRLGVVGASYGGGQSLLAWEGNPRITTAVSMYGWFDLADALIPQGVPKLAWAEALYGYGFVGAQGDYDDLVTRWYSDAHQRTHMDQIRTEMESRSIANAHLEANKRPLLVCQGMQESLFPQVDSAWRRAGGFVRAYVYTGGHGSSDAGCWSRTLDWFRFFLAGVDTRVDAWPLLESVDALGGALQDFTTIPAPTATTRYLRSPDLGTQPSSATFTVRQSLAGNPLGEPGAIWDQSGLPATGVPDALRTDPTATAFAMTADDAGTYFGNALLHLHTTATTAPYQVVATLALVHNGESTLVGHAAAAHLGNGTSDLDLTFPWTTFPVRSGDQLVLRVASNDLSWWMPYPGNYEATFDGASWLQLPIA